MNTSITFCPKLFFFFQNQLRNFFSGIPSNCLQKFSTADDTSWESPELQQNKGIVLSISQISFGFTASHQTLQV